MKKIKKLLLLLSTGIIGLTSLSSLAYASDYDGLDLGALGITDDGGGTISDENHISVSNQDVEAQYSILKQLLSPFGWSVFYDFSKIAIFLFHNEDVYKALGGGSDVNKNMFTQLMGGDKHKSMWTITSNMGVKVDVVILGLILTILFIYILFNTPITGEIMGKKNTQPHNPTPSPQPGMPSPTPTTTQSGTSTAGGDITLSNLVTKLTEMAKLNNQDPTIAKLAKNTLIALFMALAFTVSIGTMAFDYAINVLSNLRPLYYFITSAFVVVAYVFIILAYVRVAFVKLAKFATNAEEISPDTLMTDLLIKGILGAIIVGLIGGALGIFASLIVATG